MAEPSLYDDINNLIVLRLQKVLLTGEAVSLPDWVSNIMQSAADMILQQPKEELPRLVLHAHTQLDHFIREKTNG
jgi:hypothetical protein